MSPYVLSLVKEIARGLVVGLLRKISIFSRKRKSTGRVRTK